MALMTLPIPDQFTHIIIYTRRASRLGGQRRISGCEVVGQAVNPQMCVVGKNFAEESADFFGENLECR
jgi:hypothetical protein